MTDATNPNQKVLDKVRKLLAMGQDSRGNEQERETAMRQAYALLARHNLNLDDVGDGKPQEEERKLVSVSFESYPWARDIANHLAHLFFCRYFYIKPIGGKKGLHFFVGKVSNATTASELAAYVVRSVLRQSSREFGSTTAPAACAFDKGAAAAIGQRCWAMRREAEGEKHSESRALVLVDVYKAEDAANEAWLAEHVKNLRQGKDRQRDVRDRAAYASGQAYGSKVSLTNQIGTNQAGTSLRIK